MGFTDCCNCAQSANSAYTCKWGFEFQGQPIGETLEWFYGQSCPDVCNTLSQATDPLKFCDQDYMKNVFMSGNKCPQALRAWQQKWPGLVTRGGGDMPEWCKPGPIDMLASETSTP